MKREKPEDRLIDAVEVASLLDVSPSTIRFWSRTTQTENLPEPMRGLMARRVNLGRLAKWRLSDVRAWLKAQAGGSDQ